MASDPNDAVFPEEDLDDDDGTQEDEEDDDVLGDPDDDDDRIQPSPSTSVAAVTVTLALPAATVVPESPEPKQHRTTEEKKTPLDDSRRLFQRLWTDEDEIGLLQGFLEYTTQRGSSHHNDTALFYDQIKSKLQLGFNKNQLVEKLRRLKKKYRNVLSKISSGKEFSFKSAHDQATFEISRKIWPIAGPAEDDDEINLNSNPNPNPNPSSGHSNEAVIEKKTPPSRKRPRPQLGVIKTEEKEEKLNDDSALNKDINYNINHSDDYNSNNGNVRHSMKGLIEDTVRSCVTPVLKELVTGANAMGSSPFGFGGRGFGVGGLELNQVPLGFLNLGGGDMVKDEKWRKQHILELEVYSKRLELVQGEIKVALEELRSAGAGGK